MLIDVGVGIEFWTMVLNVLKFVVWTISAGEIMRQYFAPYFHFTKTNHLVLFFPPVVKILGVFSVWICLQSQLL